MNSIGKSFFRVRSCIGKEKVKNGRIEIFSIKVVFNNAMKNFEVYNTDIEQAIKALIRKKGITVEKDIANKTLRLSLQNQRYIIRKNTNQMSNMMERWQRKIRKIMPRKMEVMLCVLGEELHIHLS